MTATNENTRFLIHSDTLHVGFHGVGKASYPEDVVPPAVLRALAQHLGIELGTEREFWGDYCYFAGVTGEAFRFMEFMGLCPPSERKLVERYGNQSVLDMYREALDAAGLSFTAHLEPNLPDEASLRRAIVESLRDRNMPVIGFGCFGPPEPFLITGYDGGGDVLLGFSHFQAETKHDEALGFEPTGEYRLKDWYARIEGVAVIAGRKERPSTRGIYLAAIERAIRELEARPADAGIAAMQKWVTHLEADGDYERLPFEELKKAQSDHFMTAGDLAERRALAASFLNLASNSLPEQKEELAMARAAFQGSHDTVYEIWEVLATTSPFEPDIEGFRAPTRRRTIADLVRRLIELDERGLRHLKRSYALATNGAPDQAIAPDALLDGNVILAKADLPPSSTIWAPENIALPNALSMLRAFLGEPFGELNDAETASSKLDYVLWMGLSGAAFGMLADGPEHGNLPLVFDALGYDYELWMPGDLIAETGLTARNWGWDDNLRRRIVWNLRDRGLPVLAFNLGEWPDWYLITQVHHWCCLKGYGGSNGEGYRPNEPLDDPKNPLRDIGLMASMKGKRTFTVHPLERRSTPKPTLDELYRRAVEFGAQAIGRVRMKVLDGAGQEQVSQEPYRAWSLMMREDALFPADDVACLKQRREWLEGHEVELAERRYYGAIFLDLAAERLGRSELRDAARHFRSTHRLVEQIWSLLGGLRHPDAHLHYAEAKTRRQIADLILAMEKEEAGAAAALAR
jgi:hypothetical protein